MKSIQNFVLPLIALCWCLPLLAAKSVNAGNDPADTVDLCGDWAFTYAPSRSERVPSADAFRATMPVPGCWDDQFNHDKVLQLWPDARFNPYFRAISFPDPPEASYPHLFGTGWYRKQIDVPAAWKGRQITLQVGRVVMEACVYMNGCEVYHHLGHSTNWEVALAPHLKYGQANELVIAVNNTRADRLGCAIRGWKGRSAGIFDNVAIRMSGPARIADLYVFPDEDQLHWRVELQGKLPKSGRLQWQILDPNSKQVIAEGTHEADCEENRWKTDSFNLKPWSDRQPNLYQLEVRLLDGETCLDVCQRPFGRRRLTTDGMGLRLNGNPVFLRGVCDHVYFPLTCTPPTDIVWYRKHIRCLKEIGFNWIRCHTWTPPEPYLQAADELGIMIQVEPPAGYGLSEWRDVLRACRKHPSVVIYCCGNEEALDEKKIDFLGLCAAELREIVPDALFNPQEALRGVEYCWKKSEMGNTESQPFLHNPTRLEKLKGFSDVFGQYTWGLMSYVSLRGEPEKIDQRLAIYERPCLTHELGISGSYIDLSLEPRYQNTRIGPVLYALVRQTLKDAGLLDRADIYYRNSVVWQRLMLKNAMETARRCQRFAGYDCLGANDSHWIYSGYHCGLLNEFDELKPGNSVEDILSYNGESVLLISKQQERNLKEGEPLRRDVFLSWFGEGMLKKATLRWSLKASDGAMLVGGEQAVAEVDAGTVAPIASIDVSTPQLDRPKKATLTVELLHPGGRIQNHWDYWLFPHGELVKPQNVHVATELDATCRKKLTAGERVVLLGAKPFPVKSLNFQIALAGRSQGNLATVIARHPLTDQFPHDGYCGWQFFKMLSGAAAVQFDAVPEAFDPILEVASSYKRPLRQAAVFELQVDEGQLLVCSLILPESDPAAAYFHRRLLAYAGGEKFQPRTIITTEQLDRLLNLAPSTSKLPADTNRAFDKRGQLPKKKD